MPPDPEQSRELPFEVGQGIAHFELLGVIGHGGMGVVYKARDSRLDRNVALKCPLAGLAANPAQRKRFLREGRAASRLSHPNIIPVFEAFEAEGFPWISMQLVEGASLAAMGQAGGETLPIETVLRYGDALASALQYAHEHGILHRDVKPNNILVTPDGRPLLTDFGLAKLMRPDGAGAISETTVLTSSDAVLGTPLYMSPEHILGKPMDGRSDLYSLGSVLYYMCGGQAPFAHSSAGAVENVLHREPRPISSLNYEVPAELERIIRKCMAKDSGERYQAASELGVDIRTLRRQIEFEDYAKDHPHHPEHPSHRWRIVAAVVVTAVLVSLGFLKWGIPTQPSNPLSLQRPVQVTSSVGWEGQPVLSPDAGRIAYTASQEGDLDIYIVDAQGGRPFRVTDAPGSDHQPTWFPDGSALAFASDRAGASAIWKVGQMGGGATLLVSDATHPAISPDGSRIAFSRAGPAGEARIAVASLDDPSNATFLTDASGGMWEHWYPSWSPDGETICYSSLRENLWLVPAAGGEARPLTTDREIDFEPSWSPDGEFVYFSSYREGVRALWRVRVSGGTPERLTIGTGPESHPSVSRDHRKLAFTTAASNHDIVILDLESGRYSQLPGLRDDWMPSLAPDRSSIVFASDRQGPWQDLWLQRLENGLPSGDPLRLTDQNGDASYPAYSPDGRWIAYYAVLEGKRDIWVLPSGGGESHRVTEHGAADVHPAWSPDGSAIAFASARSGNSHIWIVAVEQGRRQGAPRQISHGETTDFFPAFSGDGKELAWIGSRGNRSEVWAAPVDGSTAPRPVTSGAQARRVRWDATSGELLVSGAWQGASVTLRRVSPQDGSSVPFELAVTFGQQTKYAGFDLSIDQTLLIYSREELQGDIWVLNIGPTQD